MSGRKYSQIELANNVREAIGCRLVTEEAYARAESLVAALGEAAKTTESLKSVVTSAEVTLVEIHQQLKSMKELFDESKMMQLTLSQVREQRQKVERLKAQLEEIAQKCREGNNAAALRVELVAMLEQLEKSRNELEPWLRDIYDPFIEETRRLIEQANQEIRATGALSTVAEKILSQTAQYKAMTDKVSERRASDMERQYVAKALQSVCKDMGFSAKFLPQNGPLEDLVLEIDTYAYGIIHFRLQLDGTIRSQSEMIKASCSTNFSQIEDRLRSLGIISSFRYEGDQRPVCLRKGEKSLPDSEPAAATERGLP